VQENLHHAGMGEDRAFVVKRSLGRAGTISVLVAVALLIFGVPACPQNTSANATLSAGDLLRRAIDGELRAQADDHTHWTYQVTAGARAKERVKLVVETRDGDLERLRSVNGQPITTEQEKQEDERIANIVHKSSERRKQRRAQEEDARRTERLFKMLPSAVVASYGERKGDLVEILFQPNPDFHPSSHEDAVFHDMVGKIWINQREDRLAEIAGHLIKEVVRRRHVGPPGADSELKTQSGHFQPSGVVQTGASIASSSDVLVFSYCWRNIAITLIDRSW
jgi:hypothetical protein